VAPRGARAAGVRRAAVPALGRRHDGRRRHPGRRLHGDVDRVVPDRARPRPRHRPAGTRHLRRRAERAQRRVLRRMVGARARPRAPVRRRGRARPVDAGGAEPLGDRRVVRGERRRRVVPHGGRPGGGGGRRAARPVGGHARAGRAPRYRRRVRGARPRPGA
jgi:hypothetical protein